MLFQVLRVLARPDIAQVASSHSKVKWEMERENSDYLLTNISTFRLHIVDQTILGQNNPFNTVSDFTPALSALRRHGVRLDRLVNSH